MDNDKTKTYNPSVTELSRKLHSLENKLEDKNVELLRKIEEK